MTYVAVEISGDGVDGGTLITGGDVALTPRAGLRVHGDPGGPDTTVHNSRVYGPVKVEIGELSDGEYGLAAIDPDTGALVSLSTLAFGMEADDWSGSFTPTTGGYEQFSGRPTVTTRIGTSGRALFLINATFNVDTFSQEGIRASVFGVGPGGATYGPSLGVATWNAITVSGATVGGTLNTSGGAADFAPGLAPGGWTFEVRVQKLAGSSPEITQASLVVMPF